MGVLETGQQAAPAKIVDNGARRCVDASARGVAHGRDAAIHDEQIAGSGHRSAGAGGSEVQGRVAEQK
jgi:hypothetical protein